MSETTQLPSPPRVLNLPGIVSANGWVLPPDMKFEDWVFFGKRLEEIEGAVQWMRGDWWHFGQSTYGERRELTESEYWKGPAYQTLFNAWNVAKRFQLNRRRLSLTFTHHAEVAALPPSEADALLDWCEETIAATEKPRSTRELRSEVHRRRNRIGQIPSSGTCTIADLHALATSGQRFGTIMGDPPWLYDNQGTRAATGDHYKGMTVDQLCELPVRELAYENAHLHLWTTNAFLFECPRIFDAWGFEFRSSFVWVKSNIGIGNYWRNSHEILLTAIRGDAKRFNDHSLRSWFECNRGKHSGKPEQVRSMVEKASPGPYLELFGRLPVERWTVFGDEIERNIFFAGAAA